MILENVKIIGNSRPVSIHISGGIITGIYPFDVPGRQKDMVLTFNDAIVFPGLINSHDHLDFNLFPPLGNKIYNNYTEWGKHIHEKYKKEINNILKVPFSLRSKWGIYKNLLCGVTTVVNHGEPSGMDNDLITVFEKTQCIHSVGFGKNWRRKLNNPFKRNLVTIHTGEGTDLQAAQEIDQLIKWNLLHKPLVGIHGVAMTAEQAGKFKALVWCPGSNYFLLNKTAPVKILSRRTNILFGTDSTLTGDWNIWSHLLTAQKTGQLTDKEIYETLTINATKTWQLNTGEVAVGKNADLVVAKIQGYDNGGFDAFFAIQPADLLLVIHNGHIKLFDDELKAQIGLGQPAGFSKFYIDGACKHVKGDLPGLIEKIRAFASEVKFPVTTNKHADYASI